jgi:hypothetical protein
MARLRVSAVQAATPNGRYPPIADILNRLS